MQPDLDQLKTEIPEYLERNGFVVFHATTRMAEDGSVLYWDVHRRPDYREFLETAGKLDIKVISMHVRDFEQQSLDDVQGELEDSSLPPSERREMERRLLNLRPYTGFTATVELSFDFRGKVYMYELRSEFMNELLNIMNEVDLFYHDDAPDDDENEGPVGGSFFSRN